MSATIKFEAAPLAAHAQTTSGAPRKKRKRAPAQGATDDCFTCSGRSIKCDRRRPYCSQCLDGGQDCAGYKTQLTWGVGVASRGKLRGLSLPVAGTAKAKNDTPNIASKPRKRSANNIQSSPNSTPSPRSVPPASTSPQAVRKNNTTLQADTAKTLSAEHITYHGPHASRPLATRIVPHQQNSVGRAPIQSSMPPLDTYNAIHGLSAIATAFPQKSSLSPSYEKNPHAQISPYPTPSPTNQYFQSYPTQHQIPLTPTTQSYSHIAEPVLLSHSGYRHAQQTSYHARSDHHELSSQPMYIPQPGILDSSCMSTMPNNSEDDVEEIQREFGSDMVSLDTISTSSSSLHMDNGLSFPISGACGVGKTPRMQYLIQYYAEVIAPVCVAFDSPTNPLRYQILALAARSESLQHAISALSASNIRQRRESGALSTGKTPGARRSSYMHLSLTQEAFDDCQNLTIQDRKREESLHKYAAVRSLNRQLANPMLRKDDSVLATLLMLCLFHVCDSGIARFQTQFEGVKKLLSIRGDNYEGVNPNTKWMTRIFTMFDSIAATVNDREGQIDGQYIDSCANPDGEWQYEMLSGIDSRVFRSISRLGRLNALGQGKPVGPNPAVVCRPIPSMPFIHGQPSYDFSTFDGNGWMRLVSDEDLFNIKTAEPTIQEQFWREWKEIRHDLQTWTFEDSRFNGSNPSQPFLTDEQRFDMCNISEAFRYSSLLYTERLANPEILSLDPRIQMWVQKALYYIKMVRADVYLLWPLFITGSECGDEQERDVIRQRCLDIQKDSGFMNNSTCLALLEKVWLVDSARHQRSGEQPVKTSSFLFRDVMLAEGNEGEWIVI